MSMKIKSEVKTIILPMNTKVEGINIELEFNTVEEFKEYKEQERKNNEAMIKSIKELFDSLDNLDPSVFLSKNGPVLTSNIKLTPTTVPTEEPIGIAPEETTELRTPRGFTLIPSVEMQEEEEDCNLSSFEDDEDDDNWESLFNCDEYEDEECEDEEYDDEDEEEYCEPEPVVRSVPTGFRLVSREEVERASSCNRVRLTPSASAHVENHSQFTIDEDNEVPGQIMFRELFKDEEIKEDYDI